jgi:hypothetical protein
MADGTTRRQFVLNSAAAAGALAAAGGSAMAAGKADKSAQPDKAAKAPKTGGEMVSNMEKAPEFPPAKCVVPKGQIGKLKIGRILLGGNLLTHYTHSRDLKYVYRLAGKYNTPDKIIETIFIAEAHGMNATVIHTVPWALDLMVKARKLGSKLQWIICPTTNPQDLLKYTEHARQLMEMGAEAIYVWGVHSDGLSGGKVDVIAKAVDAVKELGIPCGVGGHALRVVTECEKAKVNNDFYIKTFHHHNYPSAKLNHDSMWCAEPKETAETMKTVTKPWIAFKVMAAGAIPPRDAFNYVFRNGADFSLAGMFDFEIAEDAQIACDVLAGIKPADRTRPWRG